MDNNVFDNDVNNSVDLKNYFIQGTASSGL